MSLHVRHMYDVYAWDADALNVSLETAKQECVVFLCGKDDLPVKGTRQTPTRGYKQKILLSKFLC